MNVSIISENYNSHTFESVKIGDMFLDDKGTWFMKVKYDEASYDEQDVFGLSLEDETLYVFECDDPVIQFFTPESIEIK